MKKKWMFGMALAGVLALVAAQAGAAMLQDWAGTVPDHSQGTFTDKEGSKVSLSVAPGPRGGEKALKIQAHLVDWGGAWTQFISGKRGDLSKAREVRFEAKASRPAIVKVGFMDARNVQHTAVIRVFSDDWRQFTVPFSFFKRDPYQMPGAPDLPLDWSRIQSAQFIPQTHGDFNLEIGPLFTLREKAPAQTGTGTPEDAVMVQDFTFLDQSAYGPFTDGKGSSIHMDLRKDPGGKGARLADIRYELKAGGWCGYWLRSGDLWGGQDWRGAKSMELVVETREPLQFQIGFNDANQNAYVAQTRPTRGKGWERVGIPFDHFTLNPFYQPPEARKGEPLNLSHIETFNLAPVTAGPHEFQVREILLRK